MMKGQKGITLVALIITIIVMLILVGVSISVALNGGLFTKATTAVEETKKTTVEEAISLARAEYLADYYAGDLEEFPAATGEDSVQNKINSYLDAKSQITVANGTEDGAYSVTSSEGTFSLDISNLTFGS